MSTEAHFTSIEQTRRSKEAMISGNQKLTTHSRHRGPDRRRGCEPWRLCMSLSGASRWRQINMRLPRFLAISAGWRAGFVGHVGSSHSHARRSGRRYQTSFTRHIACEHGMVYVHSAVVRTTETVVIHSSGGTYLQRRSISTKRPHVVISTRGPYLQPAPATWGATTARCRVAESNCGVWR